MSQFVIELYAKCPDLGIEIGYYWTGKKFVLNYAKAKKYGLREMAGKVASKFPYKQGYRYQITEMTD